MFVKLLIANRGEIACRVARTARRLGIRTVAVYSDADAQAAHVAACDESVHVGGSRPQDSYLRGDAIIEAARRTGAQAIHPGYGFLSENAGFARDCAAAGLVFVGPSPEAIDAMGSKSAAKALMERAGVPLTPGYHGDRQEPDFLLAEARRIGFPLLIKAVAGGGGKGMRRVDRAEDFAAALAGCRRESQASFGDERVLVEKYVTPARHIEVQVFGDHHGNLVYLFERDCSVQRRHQKVIEEAPAPGMTDGRRRQMGEAAVAAARAVQYRGAGTVEFIVAADGTFYFMEMNTRLQVEHPVTEFITGLDLVEWQLRVAAGGKLPLRQEQVAMRGHAIEARIYAEDPAREFLPSIGTLEYLSPPATSEDVRVDTGVRQGDAITPYYDPMIAKLIVHGSDRAEAIAKLRAALAGYLVAGVHTNVEFLHRLTAAPSFVEARLDTALIERERAWLFAARAPVARLAWDLTMLVFVLAQRGSTAAARSPWDDGSGWRPGAGGQRHQQLRCGDEVVMVKLRMRESMLHVDVDGDVNLVSGGWRGDWLEASVDGAQVRARAHRHGSRLHLFLDGVQHVIDWVDPYLPVTTGGDRHGGLAAPMPGRVIAVLVEPGARVKAGAPLLVMEAMKMEHTITAPSAGEVAAIHHAAGDQVREGDELLTLAPVAAGS
jgi:3-methylcrotonyl-CoA carboxylase alpha subunit